MKFRSLSLFSVVVLIVAGVAFADAEKKIDLSKVKCMMSGKACSAKAAADHNGGKVHFCCNGCLAKFKKDTKKYATKANHHLVATKQATQKHCPMSGGACKDGTEVKIGGVEVAFCCPKCKGAAESKTGDDQLNLVFSEKAFKKGFEIAQKDSK